ncbi:MAG: S9 family peptidase [Sphingomonadales bacterium]|nr:S9 family peptidase [Sphingomonadales bacterium]
MKAWVFAASLVALAGASPAMAEGVGTEPLTLERVFASPALSGPTPRAVKLSPDGQWVTSLRPRADDRERFDLWAMPTHGGEWRMLVDSAKLGTSGELSEAEKMQRERARIAGTKGIVAYDWSPDSQSIMVPVDGDLFLADLKGGVLRLTQSETSELDATVSPKGGFVSFVRDQNLVVLDRKTAKETPLSSDGGGTISWGLAEFVAQEEMHRTKGHWWSPDDRLIAVERADEGGVAVVSRAAIGADGTRVYNQRYPLAGTANALVELWIMDAGGKGRVKADLGPDADIYLGRVNWAPDAKTLYVQRQSRDQKRLDLLKVDPATGAASILFSETSESWLNLHDSFRALKDGSILWQSERDGFAHLYRFKAGKWTQLTKGEWMVRAVVGLDEAKGRVFFTANKDGARGQRVYSVPLGGGAIKPMISGDPLGWFNATMDGKASRAIISHSDLITPPRVWLADAEGTRLAWIEENAVKAGHPLAPHFGSYAIPQPITLMASDQSILHAKLIRPRDAKPGQKLPVLVWVYNGPGAGRQVTQQWGSLIQQYLAQQGWAVFSVDGRGSPDRGVAFESQLYRAMGTVEVADQLAGVDWLKQQDFVDPKRIAVYGWSYGGYMTLKLLEAAPGTFAAGVSGAPVTKWELYDTHYTERYMGKPGDSMTPDAYELANAIGDAAKIADPLLLIHGMADDNVVLDHSTALMAKLQGAAVPFETMLYPGQGHGVGGPKVSVHLWTTILNFLDRTVKNRAR